MFSVQFLGKKFTVYFFFFFFEEKVNKVTGNTYLKLLQTWLFPQLQVDSDEFVFQQD
jgi:hypothetical protein